MKEVWQSVKKKKLDPKYQKVVTVKSCVMWQKLDLQENLFEEPKMSHIQVLHVKRVGSGA